MTCACMGPQNGQPLCPCRMRAADDYIRRNPYTPIPSVDLWTQPWPSKTPACWNDIACQMHDCRGKGCAVVRNLGKHHIEEDDCGLCDDKRRANESNAARDQSSQSSGEKG